MALTQLSPWGGAVTAFTFLGKRTGWVLLKDSRAAAWTAKSDDTVPGWAAKNDSAAATWTKLTDAS